MAEVGDVRILRGHTQADEMFSVRAPAYDQRQQPEMKHGWLEELGDARSVQIHLQAGRLTSDLRAQHLDPETK